jgi:hypothetical protein
MLQRVVDRLLFDAQTTSARKLTIGQKQCDGLRMIVTAFACLKYDPKHHKCNCCSIFLLQNRPVMKKGEGIDAVEKHYISLLTNNQNVASNLRLCH